MIDLHAHTSASDGQFSPGELISQARVSGLTVIAITDHDAVSGLDQGAQAAARAGITLVAGIEISATINGREAHILGHFIDRNEPNLLELSRESRGSRSARISRMIERLSALGMHCTFEEVARISDGKNLCRPHIARVLVEKGYISSVREAFDKLIGVGKPAYLERERPSAGRAIAAIRGAGGAATLAHALASKISFEEIAGLKKEGLAGLEVDHPDHNPIMRKELLALARDLDLVPTAGSDYHGELISPGRRLGSASMNPLDLERLRERARSLSDE